METAIPTLTVGPHLLAWLWPPREPMPVHQLWKQFCYDHYYIEQQYSK